MGAELDGLEGTDRLSDGTPTLSTPHSPNPICPPYSVFHIQEESPFLSGLDSRPTVCSGGLVLGGSPWDLSLADTHKAWILLLSRVVLLKCSWAMCLAASMTCSCFPQPQSHCPASSPGCHR